MLSFLKNSIFFIKLLHKAVECVCCNFLFVSIPHIGSGPRTALKKNMDLMMIDLGYVGFSKG